MTLNKLSIHIESGDIFYENFDTGENFYNFLMAQQNDETAFVPKKVSYENSFENYINSFLQSFSINDVEKFDLFSNKNVKYLFYKFNDYIRAWQQKKKIKHTQKIKDSVGLKKIEDRNKQFLIEKIIHGIEFINYYENSIEKKTEIIDTLESNYRITRRAYQNLYTDITDLYFEYIHSLLPDYIQEIDDDIKSNGWVVNNILDIENSLDLLGIFQTFYHNTGCLPLTNGLLIVPDGEALEGGDKINMKNLFEMFQQTNSHGLVSVQLLGAIHLYFNGGKL